MIPVALVSALPEAGAWMLIWMAGCAVVLIPIFPLILRVRRRRAQRELSEKVAKAIDKILEDGVITVPQARRDSRLRLRELRGAKVPYSLQPPQTCGYHGMPWQ